MTNQPTSQPTGQPLPASTAKLVADLRAIQCAGALDDLIDRAARNCFHDFLSQSATPCIDLVVALDAEIQRAAAIDPSLAYALDKVRGRAVNGAYDATLAESDQWAASPEGRALLDTLPPALRTALGVARPAPGGPAGSTE